MTQGEKKNDIQNTSKRIFNIGFKSAISLILLAVLFSIISQFVFEKIELSGAGLWLAILGGVFIIGVYLFIFGRRLNEIIATPFFAISSLLAIAIATALGTFISQNMPAQAFAQRYGENGAKILEFLQLDQVFHSWWYVALFILLAFSLLKISLIKELSVANLGFHLAHLGPIIILFGFWWDYYAGFRGLMQLQTGMETNLVSVYQANTNRIVDSLDLDFKLKLDYFKSQKFDPDHRIQIWKNDPDPIAVASIPLDLDKKRKIYSTDVEFEVKEFYPNFYLEYSYPENTDTIEAKNPGILFELANPHGQDIIQLRAFEKGRNILRDPILGTSFELYWGLPEGISNEIENYTPSSSFASQNRVLIDGKTQMVYESSNGSLSERPLIMNETNPVPGRSRSTYTIISIFPDAAYLASGPATRNEKQENPVARLDVKREAWPEAKEAFLYPSTKGPGGQFAVEGTNFVLALESIKDRETKFWESGLSVVNNDGTAVKQQAIKVNEPMKYKGFRFYQTDYDPNNPNYSGIGISYTPGLYLIYFGFWVLVAGVFILFYMRKKNGEALNVLKS